MPLPTGKGRRLTLEMRTLPLSLSEEESEAPPLGLSNEQSSDSSAAIDLVEQTKESYSDIDLESEMRELYALDDFTAAKKIADLLLGFDPHNMEAQRTAKACEAQLEGIYLTRLGGPTKVLRRLVPKAEARWLGLDAKGAQMLDRVDGRHSIEELIGDLEADRLAALRALVDLLAINAIS